MKHVLAIIGLLTTISVFAQTQNGIVKTRGRLNEEGIVVPGERLPNATVSIRGRNAVISGKDGSFRVRLTEPEYYLEDVKKEGYLLSDLDMLSRVHSYSKNPLILVMETSSQQMDDKLAAIRKIRRTLQIQLQQKDDEITRLKEERRISDEDYRSRLSELFAEQEQNEKLIEQMAQRYAKIDYDQLDAFNQQVCALILNGELTRADSLIKAKGIIEERASVIKLQQEANAREEAELKRRSRQLEKSMALVEQSIEDLARDCYSKYEIHKLQHQNDSAAYYLQLRSSLDTTNVDRLLDYSSFIHDYVGDYKAAKVLVNDALEISIKHYGEESISTAKCYRLLGLLCNELGEYEEALSYLEKGVSICKRIDVSDETLSLLYNELGTTHENLRSFETALDYHFQALSRFKASFGETSEEVATSLENIGHVHLEQQKLDSAAFYFNKTLEIRQSILDESNPDIANTLMNLGGVYYTAGNYADALPYILSATEAMKKSLSPTHPRIGLSYSNIASTYQQLGDYEKALFYHKSAIEVLEPALGENHPQVATLYSNISLLYKDLGDYDNASAFGTQALNRYTKAFGEDSPNSIYVAVSLKTLAKIYEKAGKPDLAEENYLKAIDIEKRIFANPNVYLYNAYYDLGVFYFSSGRYTDAVKVFDKMKPIATVLNGSDSSQMAEIIAFMYHGLIADYQQDKTPEKKKAFLDFMGHHVITATVNGEASPSAMLGMKGTYVLLAVNDWEMTTPVSIMEYVQSQQGKAKKITVFKDGVISEYTFENAMGLRTGYKEMDEETMTLINKMLRKKAKSKK